MKLEQVIQILQNKVKALEAQKTANIVEGNLQEVVALDLEIIETMQTLKEIE